jgi:TetR/AcrR family transcriptional regulator, cholesterol catabolism regulator
VLGIRSASLYHHMGSKDDLLYSLCVDSVERMRVSLEAALATTDDPVEQIRALIAAHVDAMLANRDALATMLIELRSLPDERRAEVIALRDEYEALVCETLERAQAAGVVRRDVAARNLTLTLLSLLNWPVFWFRPDGELPPEAFAELLASLFLDGALTT